MCINYNSHSDNKAQQYHIWIFLYFYILLKYNYMLKTLRCYMSTIKKVTELQNKYSNITTKILELVDKKLLNIPNHPLAITKYMISEYFKNQPATTSIPHKKPNYKIIYNENPIVKAVDNFDSLNVPKDHPSRKRSDTYYLNQQTLLRTHTSTHQVQTIRKTDEFVLFGDVYRRDEIDQFHYPVFHQMEAVRIFKPQDFGRAETKEQQIKKTQSDLKQTLEGLVNHLFGKVEMRWIDAYFPFTNPSLELEIFYQQKWVQMLGCGVIHPKILQNAGRSSQQIGWAAGLGLQRFAMKLFQIPDVRLFWSKDPRFIDQFKQKQISKFEQFSKYPVCYKDISFWLLNPESFEENDVHSLIREIGGDLIQKMQCIDTYKAKDGKVSKCYRVFYRSLQRVLQNEQIDKIQFQIRDYLIKNYPIQLR